MKHILNSKIYSKQIQLVNQNKKVEQYKLDLKDQNNKNIPYIEYAKENGISYNFMFENNFKDIKSHISANKFKKK